MSAQVNENNPHVMLIPIGSQNADKVLPGPKFPKNVRIKKVALLDQAGVAADDTNFLTIQLKDDGASIAEIDTRAANEGALTANVAKYAPETELDVAAGSQMSVDVNVSGTAVTTLALLQLEYYPK